MRVSFLKYPFLFLAVFISFLFSPVLAFAYQEDLAGLLSAHVRTVKKNDIRYNGVDYDAWVQDKRHARVRQAIQTMDLESLKTKEEKMAFWLNAYNFFVIDLIVQKGERDTIKDLSGVAGFHKRYRWSIDGKVFTLGDIKDKKLRPFNDPRIHFALSCAAKSCPDLRKEPYQAEKIDEQLSDQVKKMLQNKTKGFDVIEEKNTVRVTKIMKSEEEDFNRGNIKSWLQPFFPLYINATTTVTFFDFDWSLNTQ